MGWICPSTEAGIFGRSKPDPAKQVPTLIQTLQADSNASKRASAADELQSYDAQQFPQILPALIQALENDPDDNVRFQAARSIGRTRPISQQAGRALEKAADDDSSWSVRRAARVSLGLYFVVGYRSAPDQPTSRQETDEPPLASPMPTPQTSPMPMPMLTQPPVPSSPLIQPPVSNQTEPESSSRFRLFRRSEPTPPRPITPPAPRFQPVPSSQSEEPPIAPESPRFEPPTSGAIPLPLPLPGPMTPTPVFEEGPQLNPPG